MSISTGKGDGGESGLIGGVRVSKDDNRLEAYGTVDELNAILGIVRSTEIDAGIDAELASITDWLFSLGSDLATPGAGVADGSKLYLDGDAIGTLEKWIRRDEKALPPLRRFILPGGCPAAAHLHHARTVCRRAERRVVTLNRGCGDGKTAIVFLNRLSDFLFLLGRRANQDAGVADVEWEV